MVFNYSDDVVKFKDQLIKTHLKRYIAAEKGRMRGEVIEELRNRGGEADAKLSVTLEELALKVKQGEQILQQSGTVTVIEAAIAFIRAVSASLSEELNSEKLKRRALKQSPSAPGSVDDSQNSSVDLG